jgi:hypothetical protein
VQPEWIFTPALRFCTCHTRKYYAAGRAAPSIRVPDYMLRFSEELASRLVGILHGCLKTRTCYDEATAWGQRGNIPQPDAAA